MTDRIARLSPGVPPEDDHLLLMAEVSEITRMSLDTLRYLRQSGDGPPSFRLDDLFQGV